MSHAVFRTVLVVFCVSSFAQCENVRWLIEGDLFSAKDAKLRAIQLTTSKIYLPVATKVTFEHLARRNETITCVIAASVHLKGWVSVIDGGVDSHSAKFRYVTENREADILFVLVQSVKNDIVTIRGNVAENSRYGIVYEPVRNWTLDAPNAL